jgi:hypothetical protein
MTLSDLPWLIVLLGMIAVFAVDAVRLALRGEQLEVMFPRAALRQG